MTLTFDINPASVPQLAALVRHAQWAMTTFQVYADHQAHCRKNRRKGGNCICGLEEVRDKMLAIRSSLNEGLWMAEVNPKRCVEWMQALNNVLNRIPAGTELVITNSDV